MDKDREQPLSRRPNRHQLLRHLTKIGSCLSRTAFASPFNYDFPVEPRVVVKLDVYW